MTKHKSTHNTHHQTFKKEKQQHNCKNTKQHIKAAKSIE